jgi:hypothetical protein
MVAALLCRVRNPLSVVRYFTNDDYRFVNADDRNDDAGRRPRFRLKSDISGYRRNSKKAGDA